MKWLISLFVFLSLCSSLFSQEDIEARKSVIRLEEQIRALNNNQQDTKEKLVEIDRKLDRILGGDGQNSLAMQVRLNTEFRSWVEKIIFAVIALVIGQMGAAINILIKLTRIKKTLNGTKE